jgi:hypothetical protein
MHLSNVMWKTANNLDFFLQNLDFDSFLRFLDAQRAHFLHIHQYGHIISKGNFDISSQFRET